MKKWFHFSNKNKQIYLLGVLFILLNTTWLTPKQDLQTQAVQWSSPTTIPGIDLESYPPILVADQNKTVHAFFTQWVGDSSDSPRAVIYSQWTLEYGWSAPIDVITSPFKEARVTSAYLDKQGMMHLLFFGGDNTGADIYYSRAPVNSLGDARSWSTPLLVGNDAGDPENAVLVGNDQDQLSVIFYGRADGPGVYSINSKDGGNTWTNPIPIFLADGDTPLIMSIRLIKGESGQLYAIWNARTESGQGRGIYYAESKDGENWSDPILIDTATEGYGTNNPIIYGYKDFLFVVYIQTPKLMMRLSRDNGQTWDDPVVLFLRQVGVNGSPSLVVDSGQVLHLFFAQRIDATTTSSAIHGVWHSIWVNNRWTEPDAVVKGPPVTDTVGLTSFDPFEVRAMVSQGNVILVTWRTDPGEKKPNGVWYAYATLNTPELPIVPPPMVQQLSVPTNINENPVSTPTNSLPTELPPEVTKVTIADQARPSSLDNPVVPMVIAFIICFLFLLFILRRLFTSYNH